MLTRKEYEFMLMVYEATERMEPIRFVNDRLEIEAFREKYNDAFALNHRHNYSDVASLILFFFVP